MSDVHSQPGHLVGSQRVAFKHPIATFQQDSTPTATTDNSVQPLEAAMTVAAGYIETLHDDLRAYLTLFTKMSLAAYSAYHTADVKNKEMHSNPNHVPTAIRKLNYTLQSLDEVERSEGFSELQSRLDTELETIRRKLTDTYAKPLAIMTSNAHQISRSYYHSIKKPTKT